MSVRLTVLCENTVGRPMDLIGEHGFSCLLETDAGDFLFDTGQGLGIIHNADVLGKDLSQLRGIILSHGHFDPCGGLPAVLERTGPIDVFAHPDIFRSRFWQGLHEQRDNGIPFPRNFLEEKGARFRWTTRFSENSEGLFLSGEVPRRRPFETGDPHLVVVGADGKYLPDPFCDDLSLAVATEKGCVLLVGCAHAGLVNIMDHVALETGRKSFYAVIGGTHLAPADDEQFDRTLDALLAYGVEKIGLSHCTGQNRSGQIYARFPNRTFFASVATTVVF